MLLSLLAKLQQMPYNVYIKREEKSGYEVSITCAISYTNAIGAQQHMQQDIYNGFTKIKALARLEVRSELS